MRLEGEHRGGQAGSRGGRRQTSEQCAMAKMYAIEVAYGEDGGTVRCRRETAIDDHRARVGTDKTCDYNQFRALPAGAGLFSRLRQE